MKVLLTGAAGTVGHHTLYQLLEKKHNVTVIEIKNKKNIKKLKPYFNKINLIWGSINNKELIINVVKNQDIVIHLAGLIPPFADFHPELTKQINYCGTENIVEAIKEYNNKCVLMFSSSISVYGDRVKNYNIKLGDELNISKGDYYALIKKETEEMIKKSGINYIIYRLTAIMDVPKIDPLMFHMPLDTKIEISSARDTARAFVNGIEHINLLNKNIYNLGGGESCRTTYRELLKNCFKIYGLKYSYLDEKAFAEKNFHCGYYIDGDILNDIVNFRQDTLDTYYRYLEKNVSKLKKLITRVFSYFIISNLNSNSEPKKSLRENNKELIERFYYNKENKFDK